MKPHSIREATLADGSACAAIYAPFVTSSWTSFETDPPNAEEMGRRIALCLETHAWLIAEDDSGRVAGYAYASAHRARAAYQHSCDVTVYVDPAYQRRGVGRALYADLLARLKAQGRHAAFAGIALPNAGSVALHEAMGFTSVGIYREVGWKLGAWRDVGWWQRLL